MIPRAPADDLLHRAFGGGGVPLQEGHFSDRQRLALLLEGAAVLSHLQAAGWRPAADWSSPRLGEDGGLRCGAQKGGDVVLPQERLQQLLRAIFGGVPAGRGQARRIARELDRSWRQRLTVESPDVAVERLLDTAPFLWREGFGDARRALGARILRAGRQRLRVAGPGPFRRRLLARAVDLDGLLALLAGVETQSLWRLPGKDPLERARRAPAGRVREAWGVSLSSGERRTLAAVLARDGRFQDALDVLLRARGTEEGLLRIRCQLCLGRVGAASVVLRRLDGRSLTPRQQLKLASVALRLATQRSDGVLRQQWLRRLEELESTLAAEAESAGTVAAEALVLECRLARARGAWDAGDVETLEALLNTSAAARDHGDLAWRWHQASALAALHRRDSDSVVRHTTAALAAKRRGLSRFRAGGLWNDLGLGRAGTGDLAGAERAFLHSQRLLGACQGPRRTTLALINLAEVRLRRGRVRGVEEVLTESLEANRAAGNRRGLASDLELAARLELVRGEPRRALERLEEGAQAAADGGEASWRAAERAILATRARGWLGQRAAAAREWEVGAAATDELEIEERAAVAALAGCSADARDAAAGTPWEGLWNAALDGRPASPEAVAALDLLSPYRAARLVHDLERMAPATVPSSHRRSAAAALSAVGADSLAQRLQVGDSPHRCWRALRDYLQRDQRDVAGLARLFAAAGYGEASVCWAGAGRLGGVAQPLFGGVGGSQEVRVSTPGGALIGRSPEADPAFEALLAVAARDLPAPAMNVGKTPLVGESDLFRQALDRLDRLAVGDLPVLVLGESGTGKELAARRLHGVSPRASGPFVAVNCAALSETLVLSDLFGHRRGAFTGADRDRSGVFEAAHGGVVFLDEIGDLPAPAQGMLLRVLQEGEVRRLGDTEPRPVDVRVVAATHRDLDSMVADGSFRQDLYFRLRGAAITLPPLRQREGDVLLLAEHLLVRQTAPASPPRLSSSAREALRRHPWPGNVRELEQVLRRATVLAAGGTVVEGHLELPNAPVGGGEDYHQQVRAFRRRLVMEALEAADGRQAEAARRLGITRQALSYLVRQLDGATTVSD